MLLTIVKAAANAPVKIEYTDEVWVVGTTDINWHTNAAMELKRRMDQNFEDALVKLMAGPMDKPPSEAPELPALPCSSFLAPDVWATGRYTSRDFQDRIPCKQSKCLACFGGECVSPARCVIGKDGKCEGFKSKK